MTPHGVCGPSRLTSALPLLLPLAILVLLSLSPALPSMSFWSMDEANRFLQVVSLSTNLESGRLDFPPGIEYPGAEMLPGDELRASVRPLPYHYATYSGEDGRLYSQYSPGLALLSLPFYALFGQRGIYLVPAVCGALLILLLASLLRRRGFSAWHALGLSMLGTPFMFFGLTFWSHTLSLLLALTAIRMMSRSGSITEALVLATFSALFREEMLLLFLLVPFVPRSSGGEGSGGIGSGTGRFPVPNALAGLAIAAVLFTVAQKLLTGGWLGTHIGASGLEEQAIYGHASLSWIASRWFVFSRSVLSLLPGAPQGLSVAAGAVLWIAWGLFIGRPSGSRVGRGGLLVGVALGTGSCALVIARGLPSMDLMVLKHPLVIFPVLWLVRPGKREILPFLCIVAILLLLLKPMHVEDLAWGLRHLMLPMLFLAAVSVRPPEPGRRPWWSSSVALVLVLSGVSALTSLAALGAKRWRSQSLLESVRESGAEVVVTTSWEQPQDFAALIAEGRPVFMADGSRILIDILASLRHEGVDRALLLVRREDSSRALELLEAAGGSVSLSLAGSRSDPLLDLLGFSMMLE